MVAGEVPPPQQFHRYRGEVQPRQEADLSFRRSGPVARVTVAEGDVVAAGQVLASLDTSDLDNAAAMADANLAAAGAALDEAIAGPRPQAIDRAKAETRRLQAQLDNAIATAERQKSLAARGAGSNQTLDEAMFAVDQLRASLTAAEHQLDELREGTRSEQIAAARAALAVARAARQKVDVDRADSQLVAPFGGVIAQRWIDPGAVVDASRPIIRVMQESPVEVRFSLPPAVTDGLQVGDEVRVGIGDDDTAIDHLSGRSGQVIRMNPRVDPRTRTRDTFVLVDAPVDSVGLIASLWLPGERESSIGTFWLPTDALVRGVRGLWGIYVVGDGDRIELHDAKIVRSEGQTVLVDAAIPPGAGVISEGTHRIGPGVRVRQVVR